jgi:hypothetical protein
LIQLNDKLVINIAAAPSGRDAPSESGSNNAVKPLPSPF